MSRTSFEPDFKVTVTARDAAEPVIHVRGELDSGTSEMLVEAFRAVLVAGQARTITLDLSQVSFIDSAGTRDVIQLEREAGAKGVSVAIAAPAHEVTELLRTAGVIDHFDLRPGAEPASSREWEPIERVELQLPRDAQSPARARVEVRELLAGRDQTQIGDVVLLTSEIVTNAVVHPNPAPDTGVGLRIFTYAQGIRVEVDDAGEGFDPQVLNSPPPDRGRGLFLVDRFATRWGTDRAEDERGSRFMVWFELDWSQPRNLQPAIE